MNALLFWWGGRGLIGGASVLSLRIPPSVLISMLSGFVSRAQVCLVAGALLTYRGGLGMSMHAQV